jgi:WD40 repeat protein
MNDTGVDPERSAGACKYWAFVSYSHRDPPPGRWWRWRRRFGLEATWGQWLHAGLESFRLPRRIRPSVRYPGVRRGGTLYPIFRDRAELPVSAALSENIHSALNTARYLVVVCSPHAAASRWVAEEIRYFKALGRADRVLCVIADGEPWASERSGANAPECLPLPARFLVDRRTGTLTDREEKPRLVDARSARRADRDRALLEMAAVLTGVDPDLLRRETRRSRRRLRWARAALALVFLLGLGGYRLWHAGERARAQREDASRKDLQEAQALIGKNDANRALALLGRALRTNPDDRPARLRLLALLLQRNWALPAGPLVRIDSIVHPNHVGIPFLAAFSPDAGHVVLATAHRVQVVRRRSEGIQVRTLDLEDAAVALAVGPGGSRVAVADFNGRVVVSDLAGDAAARVIRLPGPSYRSLFLTPDERYLLAVSKSADTGPFDVTTEGRQGEASLWTVEDGTFVRRTPRGQLICDAVLSPDGLSVATASLDGSVRLWSIRSFDAAVGEIIGHGALVTAMAFSPDNLVLLTADASGACWVSDARSGKRKAALEGHRAAVVAVAFSPDGQLAATASEDQTARLWDVDTGKAATPPLVHQGTASSVRFSADGRCVLTASEDGTCRVWNAETGEPLTEPMTHEDGVQDAVFDECRRRVVAVTRRGAVTVWDVTPRAIRPLAIRRSAAFDWAEPAGRSGEFLAVDDETLEAWDADGDRPKGRVLVRVPGMVGARVNAGHDRLLVLDRRSTVSLWDLQTGRQVVQNIPNAGGMTRSLPGFTAEGTRLLTRTAVDRRQSWDVSTGRAVGPPEPCGAEVGLEISDALRRPDTTAEALSPDGRLYASATREGFVQLWDVGSALPVSDPIRHEDLVQCLFFCTDGGRLVTILGRDTVRLTRSLLELMSGEQPSPTGRNRAGLVDAVRVYDIRLLTAPPAAGCGADFAALAEAVGGWRLKDSGECVWMEPAERRAILDRLASSSGEAGSTVHMLAAWLRDSEDTRAVAPGSPVTVAELLAARDMENRPER